MSTICSPLSSRLRTPNFSSTMVDFCWLFTLIALDDALLRFCLSKKNQCCRRGNYMTLWYHQGTQFIHVTEGVTVTSLSASLLQKLSVALDCLFQILLSQKLSHKFKKWCKFSSSVKAKSCKKKLYCTWQLASLFNECLAWEQDV